MAVGLPAGALRSVAAGALGLVLVGVLAWADARQRAPVGTPFSYALRGMNAVSGARGDKAVLQAAVKDLEEALRQDPQDPTALFAMGWALHSLGSPELAEPYYLRAGQRLAALQSPTQYNLALLRMDRGDAAGCLLEVNALLARDPVFPGAAALRQRALAAQAAVAPSPP
jgi:tetratricopeptide (TPR) repeat protein